MRPKYFLLVIFSAAFLTIVLVLLAASSKPSFPHTPDVTTAVIQIVLVETVDASGTSEAQADGSVPTPTTNKLPAGVSAPTKEVDHEDGSSLVMNYCGQCHLPRQITGMELNRTEWEDTLARMEALGVQLSEGEKSILLDYLMDVNRPR